VVEFTNVEMSELTGSVIFMEPYIDHPNNQHTSPHLDAQVEALRVGLCGSFCLSFSPSFKPAILLPLALE